MFEESLVESTPLLRTHNRLPALLSLSAQLLALTLFLAIPLLHPELLPMNRLLPATLAAPHPTPPPPVHLKPIAVRTTSSAPATPGTVSNTSAPRLHPSGPAVDTPPIGFIDLGLRTSSLPPAINARAAGNSHVIVRSAAINSNNKPTRISSGVSAGLLLTPILPYYPSIARAAGAEGTVVIEAIISRRGSIESAHALSGSMLLQSAALDAVRRARYRPFLLNGQPTEVQTTITINFRLGS